MWDIEKYTQDKFMKKRRLNLKCNESLSDDVVVRKRPARASHSSPNPRSLAQAINAAFEIVEGLAAKAKKILQGENPEPEVRAWRARRSEGDLAVARPGHRRGGSEGAAIEACALRREVVAPLDVMCGSSWSAPLSLLASLVPLASPPSSFSATNTSPRAHLCSAQGPPGQSR